MPNIQFKRGADGATLPPLKPGEPAMLGGNLYVGDVAGVAVKMANAAELGGGDPSVYDKVIRTQAEFEALIASPTWLNAVSVCFIGNGGTLKFTRSDGLGCKIPQTVKQIQGMNSAMIVVSNFVYNESTNKAGLWYETIPTTDDYCVNCISVRCSGVAQLDKCHGIANCHQLSNCAGTSYNVNYADCFGFNKCTRLSHCTGFGTGFGHGYGFYDCTMLTNCVGKGYDSKPTGAAGRGSAFVLCTQITNCTGHGIGPLVGAGFEDCTYLTNCIGAGNGTSTADGFSYGRGFVSCKYLLNCDGRGISGAAKSGFGDGFSNCYYLSNCTGSGTGVKTGYSTGFDACRLLSNCAGTAAGGAECYGFKNCSYLNGCKQGETASTTAFLGGACTKVDTTTVVAT